MSTSMIDSPFQAPAEQGPRTARLEIMERHHGKQRRGPDFPLVPNLLRVNGRTLWATQDDPVVVKEIRVDGRPGTPMVVVIRFLARSLLIGDGPDTGGVQGRAPGGGRFPVLAVPGLVAEPGTVSAPYVLIDEMRLLLGGDVVVEEIQIGSVDGEQGREALVVDVPLLCRSVVFDDELATD